MYAVSGQKDRPPIIAITPDVLSASVQSEVSYIIRKNYADAISDAGGIAVVLHYELSSLDELVERFDGFVISGSTPGVSEIQGRSDFERKLIGKAVVAKKPILGICNGMQMIGIALGGKLIGRLDEDTGTHHIPSEIPDELTHTIDVEKSSGLGKLAKGATTSVNSLHRQGVDESGDYMVAARAPDGVVEAIEGRGEGYVLGVQWHPEYRLSVFDRAIFANFVDACRVVNRPA